MPIKVEVFENAGHNPAKEFIQENIMRVLRANPHKAFSSVELENMLDVRRQSINQALRSLDAKGWIKRGFIMENKRSVCYARLNTEESNDTIKETESEESQEMEKPAKRASRKKPKKGSGKRKKPANRTKRE